MRTLQLPSGQAIPVLGMGTWRMGEATRNRQSEIDALRHGLDLGLSLIDTAEMYGEGGAEEVIAPVIANRRSEVFLVSKVYPHNASRKAGWFHLGGGKPWVRIAYTCWTWLVSARMP